MAWEAFQELGGEDGGRSYCIPEMLNTWDQNAVAGHANWRQGGLYLTTSRKQAIGYMGTAGPEMGRAALSILEDIRLLDSRRADEILGSFPAIEEWACAPKVGVLIKVTALDSSLVRSETGNLEPNFIERLTEINTQTEEVWLSDINSLVFEYLRTIRTFEVVDKIEFA